MKKVAIVTILSMVVSFATAEVMVIYPKGISKEQVRKHGRARTRVMIHYRTRSLIYGKLNKKQKEEVTAVAMGLKKHTTFVSSLKPSPTNPNGIRKHNWSTSDRIKKRNKNGILKH